MQLFRYKNYIVEYELIGHGTEIMLAFHGFGRHSSDFNIFESTLGKHYQIISFNLFFHGNSKITSTEELPDFTKEHLRELMNAFFLEKQITTFSLLGYSLGGKIVLSCIELFPQRIQNVFLFAPDGIKINPWYMIASKTTLGRQLYKRFLVNPQPVFKFINFLKKTGLINKTLFKFVDYHLENEQKRRLVYDVWMVFRNLIPGISKIQKYINSYNINILLIFGEFDIIIPPSIGKKFIKKLAKRDIIRVVPMGHRLITQEMNSYLKKYLIK